MEAILWAWVVASNPRRIGLISASISLHVCHDFLHDFRHDRATIGPRSGVNLTAQASSIDFRSMGADSAPFPLHFRFDRGSIVPRSRLDRAAIAARSRLDRAAIVFFLESPAPSDYLIVMKIRCSRLDRDRAIG